MSKARSMDHSVVSRGVGEVVEIWSVRAVTLERIWGRYCSRAVSGRISLEEEEAVKGSGF